MAKTNVLVVGLDPSPSASPDLVKGASEAVVRAGIEAAEAQLNRLGYDVEFCHIDSGETAETMLRERLKQKSFDCIVIGGGVRLIPQNTSLFEKLVNIAHVEAPQAKLCFNTKPTDIGAAVQRCIPPSNLTDA